MTEPDARERYGAHRVLEPDGAMLQPAWRVDPDPPLRDSEVEIAVDRISLDMVSFMQLWKAGGGEQGFGRRLLELVAERGKLHNPDTDSGGTLLGGVAALGALAMDVRRLEVGERVVPLVSTTAIPLRLESVDAVRPAVGELHVKGFAIIPLAYPMARVPSDLDEALVIAAADVAGAPGLVHDLLPEVATLVVLGAAGTAGLLACAAGRERGARVVVVDLDTDPLQRLGLAEPVRADATDALAVHDALARIGAAGADLVAQVASASGCEAAAVSAVADEGTIVFFSMATSFQRCVNVADVFGKRPRMVISNALRRHHAPLAFELLRRYPRVREELEQRLRARARRRA
jgi:L-erythro-3,5-diaminohexanoate dehydrogenase